MPHMRTLVSLGMVFFQLQAALAQSPPPLSPHAVKIKARVQALPADAKLTVNMLDDSQYCGTVQNVDAESFSMHEVDLKRTLTVRYEDVQKVRKGYGGKGFGGRRVYPRTNMITALVFVGVLFGLVIGLLATQNA